MPITLSHLGPVLKAVYARQQPPGSPGSPLVILGPPNWHARRHIPLQLKLKKWRNRNVTILTKHLWMEILWKKEMVALPHSPVLLYFTGKHTDCYCLEAHSLLRLPGFLLLTKTGLYGARHMTSEAFQFPSTKLCTLRTLLKLVLVNWLGKDKKHCTNRCDY